jgi:hypothetical protein
MPVYFLHVEGRVRIEDEFGLELPDNAAARREARGMARDLLRHQTGAVPWRVVVINEAGERIEEVVSKAAWPHLQQVSRARRPIAQQWHQDDRQDHQQHGKNFDWVDHQRVSLSVARPLVRFLPRCPSGSFSPVSSCSLSVVLACNFNAGLGCGHPPTEGSTRLNR